MTGKPDFLTNRSESSETVASGLQDMFASLRHTGAREGAISIASAYFNVAGFNLLAAELGSASKVRLLLGAEPQLDDLSPRVRRLTEKRSRRGIPQHVRDAVARHEERLSQDRDLLGFTMQEHAQAKDLVQWLAGTNVEVRRYERGFLHGKAYILESTTETGERGQPQGVVAGSSNFTYAGLSTNNELNLGRYESESLRKSVEWFDALWNESSEYDLARHYQEIWSPHSPWSIHLRMLYELYGDQQEGLDRKTSNLGLTGFQADGVWRAKRILAARGGVIIADEVGLGKTYVAGELIYEAAISRRQKVLIICPASLRDSTWRPFLQRENLPAEVMSYEELVKTVESAERRQQTRQKLDEFALVIVDEAHNLRSSGTQRSESMKTLLAGDVPKDVVMLTATPVNNSLFDLYNLISYFQTSDAAFASDGVPSLSKYFRNANAMDPDDLNPDSLFSVLEQVAVRRTRRFVKNHYAGDYIVVNGQKQTITFPTCSVNRLDYALGDAVPGIFEQLATALAGGLSHDHAEAGTLGQLRMARYTQSQYLLNGDPETYETQNAGLLRSGLLKRFESSGHAFRRTLEAMIGSHEQFLSALEQGWVLRGDALREWASSDTDNLSEVLDRDSEDTSPITLYRYEDLHSHVKEDLGILQKILASATVLEAAADDKVDVLVRQLTQIARESLEQGVSPTDQRNRRKSIIFSYFADTVDYVYEALLERIRLAPELQVFRDRIVSISGQDAPQLRDKVIANFAPDSVCAGDADDLYDIVITTDVLAEGVNLQQAKHIVNYDLPWNPMRLVQRHGRIDRIGSSHDEVFMHCFFPDEQLDAFLNLEEILHRKLKQAGASVGVGKVLPGIDGSDNVITETREIIEQLRQEESLLFESGGLGGLSGEEFRQRLATAFQSDAVREQVLSLPWGSGSGMKAPMNGFVFCIRVADHEQPWFRYVPCLPDFSMERDASGNPTVVRDTISALSYTIPASPEEPQHLSDDAQVRVYDAWLAARDDVLEDWQFRSDPRNIAPQIPKTMRDVAAFVKAHGHVLGSEEETLYQALQTPYSNAIQRELRMVLKSSAYTTDESRVLAIKEKAEHLRLKPAPLADPLPEIGIDDIRLVSWLALVGE